MVRLITFEEDGVRRVGVELTDGGDVADVTKQNTALPTDMRSLLEMEGGIAAAAAYVKR